MTAKKLNVYQRASQVTEAMGSFSKDGTNQVQRYNYTSIEQMVSDLHKPLRDAGLMVFQSKVGEQKEYEYQTAKGQKFNTKVEIETVVVNMENPDDRFVVGTSGSGWDMMDKGVYKAMSGARKYGYFMAFNLMSGDDDPEYTSNSKPARQQARPPQQQQRQQAPATVSNNKYVKILFGDVAFPPQNDRGYDIVPKLPSDVQGKPNMAWMLDTGANNPKTEKTRGFFVGELTRKGYATPEERRKLYQVFFKINGIDANVYKNYLTSMNMTAGILIAFVEYAKMLIPKRDEDPLPFVKSATQPEPELITPTPIVNGEDVSLDELNAEIDQDGDFL